MRIRKRQVPLPLSSLSPVPLTSDPLFSQSYGVQLHPDPPTNSSPQPHKASCFPPQLSRHQLNSPIGAQINDVDQKGIKGFQVLLEKDERCEEGEGSNNTSKISSLGAEIGNVAAQKPISSRQVVRWCEREKVFPLKKRRGSFERRSDETIMDNDKKMKTKMNKKCAEQNGFEEGQQKEDKEIDGCSSTSGKKRSRGGALMEGSRCSRVNGRGWRCCQQTLVGYSLCEHHLGKGRLRSMNSVRNRSLATTTPKKAKSRPLSSEEKDTTPDCKTAGTESEDGDEKKPLTISKKKIKLGTFKARSMSSLLGQSSDWSAVGEIRET
ncbi:hypothetical protein K2173_005629 [Erythroxylum novogranatense]|uniref:WRC domain-containing protein n=1 Tax=Erythroxylum novogranatense TaxID=1862640 RepID=A0AAV8SQJ7_9ROSI|nr:hypothetical protein K2173_005629 [Erythroxylum novogranatense]